MNTNDTSSGATMSDEQYAQKLDEQIAQELNELGTASDQEGVLNLMEKRALNWIYSVADDAIAAREWTWLSVHCPAQRRLTVARKYWRRVPESEREAYLLAFYGPCEVPSFELVWLYKVLRSTGPLFDSPEARAAYEAAPQRLTAYRGTVQDEVDDYVLGVSWSLDREKAKWFATAPRRFQNTDSAPVLLTIDVDKDEIRGWIWDRTEQEVLILHPVPLTPADRRKIRIQHL